MTIEFIYYLIFASLILLAITSKGRSLFAKMYWSIDERYFRLLEFSKDDSRSPTERRKYKFYSWLVLASIYIPIAVVIGGLLYYKLIGKFDL